jgi:hypothetical protein
MRFERVTLAMSANHGSNLVSTKFETEKLNYSPRVGGRRGLHFRRSQQNAPVTPVSILKQFNVNEREITIARSTVRS